MKEYIGFPGVGNTIELELIEETEKAYRFYDEETDTKIWLPKSAFDDTGSLTETGVRLYYKNRAEEMKKAARISPMEYVK